MCIKDVFGAKNPKKHLELVEDNNLIKLFKGNKESVVNETCKKALKTD